MLIFLLVGVANIVDVHVIGTGAAIRGAVICFYLSNEGVSILENAAHIGLPVPEKLKTVLEQLLSRINTPYTNEHFANYCLEMIGQPYWYGTCGNRATEDLLQRKAMQYSSSYPASRMKRYRQDIANHAVVADCIGEVKDYAVE